jgi:hypothetical protein
VYSIYISNPDRPDSSLVAIPTEPSRRPYRDIACNILTGESSLTQVCKQRLQQLTCLAPYNKIHAGSRHQMDGRHSARSSVETAQVVFETWPGRLKPCCRVTARGSLIGYPCCLLLPACCLMKDHRSNPCGTEPYTRTVADTATMDSTTSRLRDHNPSYPATHTTGLACNSGS